jgi:hypothetical protein
MPVRNRSLVVMAAAISVMSSGCTPRGTDQTPTMSLPNPTDTPTKPDKPAVPTGPPSVLKVTVGKNAYYVNLNSKETPPTPKFPALETKPGVLRGYVLDASGKPLKGAYIGVRVTMFGGRYSGASAETDDKGYYEIQVPQGAAHFYAAGYTVDYADGRAALTLHPADGKLSTFVSSDGSVENFVLWTYGVADRDSVSENPRLRSNFYGGSLYVGHFTADAGDTNAPPSNLRTGTEIEITLTPEGKLLDGSVGQQFVIKKAVYGTGFTINNIPVGQYRLTAKRADGQPLLMKLNKPKGLTFGIVPEQTTEGALLSLHPGGVKASMATPGRGNWDAVEVYVEIPMAK